jgi:hypothetical protein
MSLYRIDPEIYPLMMVCFTSMSWGGMLVVRKAAQARYENAQKPLAIESAYPSDSKG